MGLTSPDQDSAQQKMLGADTVAPVRGNETMDGKGTNADKTDWLKIAQETFEQSKSYYESKRNEYLEAHKNGYYLLKCAEHGNLKYENIYIKRYKSRKKYLYKAECIQCEAHRRAENYGKHNISLHGNEITCAYCKENKSFISFHYAELKQKYPRCHDCGILRSNKSNRNSKVLRIHGGIKITREWYDEKFKSQNGLCGICEKPDLTRKLSVDHNHETKKLRDLLCRRCNLAIGQFFDSPYLLRKAADYLDSHA